jgi:hypothetical protein
VSLRRLLAVLAALAVVRVGIALAVLAAHGSKLPLVPRYDWRGFEGDANGYYSAARGLLSAATAPAAAGAAALCVLLALGLVLGLRRRRAPRWSQVLAAAAGAAGAATAVVAEMAPAGAPVVGWPLLWAIPLAPLRVFGEPSVHAAWGVGVALSLLFVAAATVACGLLGREATGSDRVGIGAAALFMCWPLLTGLLGGEQAWENGTWLVDAGLHLYTEPLSTALVTAALVLVVRRASRETEHAAAGLLLGFSTVVKLTNGVIALALLPLVWWRRGPRAAAVYAAGAALWAPLVAVYWNKGYIANYGGSISASDHPWGLRYAADNWTDSLLFTPTVLAILAPLAIAGLLAIRERWPRLVLLAPIVVTAAVYTVYYVTALHPRFLFVALPCLFVLEAAGAAALAVRVRGART